MSEQALQYIDPTAVTPEHELYLDKYDGTQDHVPDADDLVVTPDTQDNYVGAKVNLSFGGTMRSGSFKRRARDAEGELFGTRNSNPILDTRLYEVDFPDGNDAEFTANVISENMFSQCDCAGNQYRLMSGIVDHKSNEKAVSKSDRYVVIRGRQFPRNTTVGWKLCIEWRDGSTSWERLSNMKEAYPVLVAKYATAQEIIEEHAFAWWCPYVLRIRDRIIAGVKARVLKKRFKYGFEVPETVARAIELDEINGNTLWQDGIEKEITAVRVAFKTLNEGGEPPPGYQYMKCHMIFEIKLDGFRRKARLVGAGCIVKDTPAVVTYASVLLRDTVRIALTIAALNVL